MTPLVIRYPLDPTGTNVNNLVANEPHTLENRRIRAIAPMYGAFFTTSLKIFDLNANAYLTPNQFSAVEMYELPTDRYGQEICAVILITDPSVSNNVNITYQALGGEFSTSAQAIIQQIDQLNLDNRPIGWPDIIGKPSEYPPSMHLHDIGDIYGFEYVVHALDRIRAAIELGDAASHDAIYGYIDKIEGILQTQINSGNAAFLAHLNDHNNPHQVTAAQLNVYTIPQTDGLLNAIRASISNHLADYNNPHHVTAAQLGVYLKTETDALLANLNNGITQALNNHLADHNNPHQVTAAQLGVYLKTEIDAKLANVNNGLSAHLSDYTNPHRVNASQVGLGNVPNYPMATDAEFAASTLGRFCQPYQVQNLMAAHRASGDHDWRYVMKSQAGVDGSILVQGSTIYIWAAGGWRQIYPAVYS